MKRVLILANDYPPLNTIGAQRPFNWYKYFNKYGLYPIVITRDWDKNIQSPNDLIKPSTSKGITKEVNDIGTLIRVPFKPNLRDCLINKYGLTRFHFLRKVLTIFYTFAEFFFFAFDARRSLYFNAKKYLESEKVDYIIATGEPYILFKYASKLSCKFKIPWIADYRDGWSTTVHSIHLRGYDLFYRRFIARHFEKKYIRNTSVITSASPNYAKDLKNLFPKVNVKLVYNGYNPDSIKASEGIQQNKESFDISYIGSLYSYMPVELFLNGFIKFLELNPLVKSRILFYGTGLYASHKEVIESYKTKLGDRILIKNRIPLEELYQELRKSSLFLLLANKNTNALAGKVFDYFALNRKVLMVQPDGGILEELFDKCEAGIKCNTEEEVCDTLTYLYEEFNQKGFISHQSVNFEVYSRDEQTKILADLIHKI